MHWLLAYAGLVIHQLMKMAATPGKFSISFKKKDVLVLIASAISIPAILVICTDTSLADVLPINYVTAFLAGYQTQEILKSFTGIGSRAMSQTSEPTE